MYCVGLIRNQSTKSAAAQFCPHSLPSSEPHLPPFPYRIQALTTPSMDPEPPPPAPQPTAGGSGGRSWSIYERSEITDRYEILNRIGSGAYADVYRARRKSDNLTVALKEIHDYHSSFREIEALQTLRHAPNVVDLIEYFWSEDEDAVIVLEFLPSDLATVIKEAKRRRGGGAPMGAGELKQWMVQVLRGVDDCHRSLVVHRDLKPSNLLVSDAGVLKLADFGQARILQESRYMAMDNPLEPGLPWLSQQLPTVQEINQSSQDGLEDAQESKLYEDDYLREVDGLKAKFPMYDTDKDTSFQDGDVSCLATCSTGDIEDDPFKGSSYSFEAAETVGEDESGALTSCVGTRWFRAPELLYGSTCYGLEVDLWSLGCIFAELLSLEPLFPGTSDLDQLAKIINVLGDMNEETWPGCSKLPDYNKISFNKIENPVGLESCLPNRSSAEVNIVRKLLCYDPVRRATAAELLSDAYFIEDPQPVPLNELKVPSTRDDDDESSGEEWRHSRDMESDSDLEEFSGMDVVRTEKGFSLRSS